MGLVHPPQRTKSAERVAEEVSRKGPKRDLYKCAIVGCKFQARKGLDGGGSRGKGERRRIILLSRWGVRRPCVFSFYSIGWVLLLLRK